jgi:hypothetical protein
LNTTKRSKYGKNMQHDERRKLVELFIEAGQAHGKAHIETNGEDAEKSAALA